MEAHNFAMAVWDVTVLELKSALPELCASQARKIDLPIVQQVQSSFKAYATVLYSKIGTYIFVR